MEEVEGFEVDVEEDGEEEGFAVEVCDEVEADEEAEVSE